MLSHYATCALHSIGLGDSKWLTTGKSLPVSKLPIVNDLITNHQNISDALQSGTAQLPHHEWYDYSSLIPCPTPMTLALCGCFVAAKDKTMARTTFHTFPYLQLFRPFQPVFSSVGASSLYASRTEI